MQELVFNFLTGILGTDGARALRKAADREPALEPLLVPRAALSWIQQRERYEGHIPGIPNSYLRFEKSESGYQGSVSMPEGQYAFQDSDVLHLASALGVAVGVDLRNRKPVRDQMLVRLGKSIDALVQAQDLFKTDLRDPKRIFKTDLPGLTAKPTVQVAPEPPEAPQKQPAGAKPQLPKTKKRLPVLKIEKSEVSKPCDACGGQIFKDDRFVGCICWKSFSKSIKTTVYSDGSVLEFGPGIDRQAFLALKKALLGD